MDNPLVTFPGRCTVTVKLPNLQCMTALSETSRARPKGGAEVGWHGDGADNRGAGGLETARANRVDLT